MKHYFISALLVFISTLTSAQLTFHKLYGTPDSEYLNVAKQTSNGDFIIGGFSNAFGFFNNAFVIRTDNAGDTIWTKSFNNGPDDYVRNLHETSDGGFILGGSTVNVSAGQYATFFMKTDSIANTEWYKMYYMNALSIFCSNTSSTSDGGMINTGTVDDTAYLMKIDSSGTLQWTKTYNHAGEDYITCAKQTQDGGYIILGTTFINPNYDISLIKTDAIGDTLWTKAYATVGNTNDNAADIIQTYDGGYVITGTIVVGANPSNMFVMKIDSTGNVAWLKGYGGSYYDDAYSITQLPDSGFIITGAYGVDASNSDMCIIKMNANGDTLWTNSYGGIEYDNATTLSLTDDNGYLIGGNTSSFGAIDGEYSLIKTDSVGNSGCNEQGSINITISFPPFLVKHPVVSDSSIQFSVLDTVVIETNLCNVTTLCFSTSIEQLHTPLQNTMIIYPNPVRADNDLTIDFNQDLTGESLLRISNVLGEIIFEENLVNVSTKKIKLENMLPGMYFISVINNGNPVSKKLIINQ